MKSWDAALAASAPDAHRLHEQKAQVRHACVSSRMTALCNAAAAARASPWLFSCSLLAISPMRAGVAGARGGLEGGAVRAPSRGAAAGLGAGSPDAGASAGGTWRVGTGGLQAGSVSATFCCARCLADKIAMHVAAASLLACS